MRVKISIMPRKSILDPQGITVKNTLANLGFQTNNVTIGKLIEITLPTTDTEEAKTQIEKMCDSLLVNKLTEDYTYNIIED